MNKKILPLIGMVLLSGPLAAEGAVLFQNPYDPTGTGGVGISYSFAFQGATTFTLKSASTVEAVSVTVDDVFGHPMGSYNWSIYTDVNGMPGGAPGPISLPTGAPTYLPIVSGTAASIAEPGDSIYSWRTLVLGDSPSGDAINEVTIQTGPIALGPGTYFLALSGQVGVGAEEWLSGAYNTGNVSAFVGAFTPLTARGDALTVYGRKSAPEIDPSSAVGGITLLFGGLMVLRGRRPVRPVA
jgi:hypothetical protein